MTADAGKGALLDLEASEGVSLEHPNQCKDLSCVKLAAGSYLKLPVHNFGRYAGLTFSLWFKPLDTAGSGARLFDFGSGAEVNNIYIAREGATSSTRFQVLRTGKRGLFVVAPNTWTASIWRHIVWTLTPTSSVPFMDATWSIFIDGKFVADKVAYYPPDANLTWNYIGKSSRDSDGAFAGYLDSFHIYPAALSFNEARALSWVSDSNRGRARDAF